jgi:hypothetical protein
MVISLPPLPASYGVPCSSLQVSSCLRCPQPKLVRLCSQNNSSKKSEEIFDLQHPKSLIYNWKIENNLDFKKQLKFRALPSVL